MVFGTGGRPLLPDNYGEEDDIDSLKIRIKNLERENADLRRQLMLAKNTNLLYENPDYGRSD